MSVIKAMGFRSTTLKDSYLAKILVGISDDGVVVVIQRLLLPELPKNSNFKLIRKFKNWFYVENEFYIRKESLEKIYFISELLNKKL